MRRVGILFLALLAVLAMTAPNVSAQPKVTITGLIDNITSWSRNMNHEDSNPARTGDSEWYARMRVRPDITAEVGTTKFVLGLEIDYSFGQVGPAQTGAGQKFGTLAGLGANTDAAGIIELKWAYTEFMLPVMPLATLVRVGAQPSTVMYKPAVLQQGDFAGVHLTTTVNPMIKLNFTYNQMEEEQTGIRDGFTRGEDFAIYVSAEVTPFKGLDIRPIYSFAEMEGTTSGNARQGRGGVSNTAAFFTNNATGAAQMERRHTIGVDARWRLGAFSLDPTVLYQWGTREILVGFNPTEADQKRSAWLVDVRGGWQAGPLLLEGAVIYTTGNKAGDDVRGGANMKFYEPISTDSGFYGTWAEIFALNIDYFNSLRPRVGGLNTISSIGYDKYGLLRLGTRASYALTPAFTLRTAVTANWTAQDVDTSSTLANATGLTPGNRTGDASYLGTELDLGFQWRFAPNVALDVVGAYLFAGNALATHTTTGAVGGATNGRDPKDVQAVTARVRYTF
jgi:hypothetical protein